MKQLFLIRHAKSDWASEAVLDIDRPLNERGCTDAYLLSKWYLENEELPDRIISSPAVRALSTALIFARKFGINENDIVINRDLYESTVSQYLKVLASIENKVERVMLFGHNPVITNLSNELNSEIEFENVPTCGIIKISWEGKNWEEFTQLKNGKIAMNKFPKNFK